MHLNFKLFSRFYYALGLLLIIVLVGTFGYMIVMGWGLIDSFYMTVITLSTVGFGEVHGLSEAGRLFTSFLIISSFGIFAYAISSITRYIIGGEYRVYLNEYKSARMVEKLDQHTLICGFGRVGRQAAKDLKINEIPYILIERDQEIVQDSKTDDRNAPFVEGDATNDETLKKAGIERAQAIITCLPNDADNLYVVLTAREMNPGIQIIARASNRFSVKKLKIAGANHVIMPDTVGGAHMASLVINPDVIEFLDQIKVQGSADINLEEVSFDELPENIRYKTIGELSPKVITGCNIIGYKTPDGKFIINPSDEMEVVPNSKLFVLGTPMQISELNKMFGIDHG